MGVEMKTVRVRGWCITFVMKDKNGRVCGVIEQTVERRTKKATVDAFESFRAGREAKRYTFEKISEPHKFDEKREYICF